MSRCLWGHRSFGAFRRAPPFTIHQTILSRNGDGAGIRAYYIYSPEDPDAMRPSHTELQGVFNLNGERIELEGADLRNLYTAISIKEAHHG